MFYDLVSLNWFDVVSVSLTFAGIILVQLINACLYTLSELPTTKPTTAIATTEATIPTTPTTTTAATATTATATSVATTATATENGKLKKQNSVYDCENGQSLSSNNYSSSNSSTISITQQIKIINKSFSFDIQSDDYQEDEDTLSLENLFPCDQSEIYASRKISYIIDELIQTEANYVNNLRKGLKHYGQLQEIADLPESLVGAERQFHLLGNINEVLDLHEKQILPLMLRNQHDLKNLFDEFAAYFDKDNFYCYVIFTMGKKTSMQMRQEQREWFQKYQTEINDKLGIDSFLVQPIQRLTRYPLLLQQFISEFYKSGISCKPVLTSVCKLETRMRRLLAVVNQAEEIPNIDEINGLDLRQQGYFRRATEFDAHHLPTHKKYRAKVFLFDRCLVCTEVRKRRLTYKQHYNWEQLELQQPMALATAATAAAPTSVSNKCISLLLKSGAVKKEEYTFTATEACIVKQWLQTAHKIIQISRIEASQRGKFSLPMDLVLAVLFAIWLIWRYL